MQCLQVDVLLLETVNAYHTPASSPPAATSMLCGGGELQRHVEAPVPYAFHMWIPRNNECGKLSSDVHISDTRPRKPK